MRQVAFDDSGYSHLRAHGWCDQSTPMSLLVDMRWKSCKMFSALLCFLGSVQVEQLSNWNQIWLKGFPDCLMLRLVLKMVIKKWCSIEPFGTLWPFWALVFCHAQCFIADLPRCCLHCFPSKAIVSFSWQVLRSVPHLVTDCNGLLETSTLNV